MRDFRGAAANLDNNGLTVTSRKPWSIGDLDAATLPYRSARAQALATAAAAAAASGRNAGWWQTRERAQGVPDSVRMAECGKNIVRLVSSDTGEIIEQVQGCGHPLCAECGRRRSGKLARRVSQSIKQLENELRTHDVSERMRHRAAYMITLTVRHSGSVAKDLDRLTLAWSRFRASWKSYLGESFAFVRFTEVASKRSAGGHAHWHVLAWWPVADWTRLQRWWRKAVARADARLGVVWDDERKRRNAGNLQIEKARNGAAAYCAKVRSYASKSTVDVSGMELDAIAEMVAKLQTARRVSASRKFWLSKEFFTEWTVLEKVDTSAPRPRPGWWRPAAVACGPPSP